MTKFWTNHINGKSNLIAWITEHLVLNIFILRDVIYYFDATTGFQFCTDNTFCSVIEKKLYSMYCF